MNLNGDDIIDRLSQVMLSRNGGLMIISSIVVHSILQRPMARLLRTTSGLFNDHQTIQDQKNNLRKAIQNNLRMGHSKYNNLMIEPFKKLKTTNERNELLTSQGLGYISYAYNNQFHFTSSIQEHSSLITLISHYGAGCYYTTTRLTTIYLTYILNIYHD